jgi:hypothetical protein
MTEVRYIENPLNRRPVNRGSTVLQYDQKKSIVYVKSKTIT